MESIRQHHLPKCESTQQILKELTSSNDRTPLLVSCDEQTAGHGRRGTSWQYFPGSLAMSFTLNPNPIITLTPLEIGILVVQFFDKHFNSPIGLKWPNDLMDLKKRKVGGIICELKSNLIFAGLGINKLDTCTTAPDSPYLWSGLSWPSISQKELSLKIYHYILKNRLSENEVIEKWNKHCLHINQDGIYQDSNQKISGKFKGIDSEGRGILETSTGITEMIAGSFLLL